DAAEASEVGVPPAGREDGVELRIHLAARGARVLVAHRKFDLTTHGESRRARARPKQIHFAADPQIAQLITGPALAVQGMVYCDAASRAGVCVGTGKEQRPGVTVDSGHQRPAAKDLGTVAEAVSERDRESGDVREALAVIDVHVLEGDCPFFPDQYLSRRNEPGCGGIALRGAEGRPGIFGLGWSLGRRLSALCKGVNCAENYEGEQSRGCGFSDS